jgi:prevent-host-death family protein
MASDDIHYGLERARNRLPSIVAEANAGKRSIITRHGKPCAAVVPMEDLEKARVKNPQGILALRGTGKGLWGKDSSRSLAELRDEWSGTRAGTRVKR